MRFRATTIICLCTSILPACAIPSPVARQVAASETSQLNWGVLFQPAATMPELVKKRIQRVEQVAEQNLNLEVRPVAALHLQGLLSSDPLYQASNLALTSVGPLFDLAICARLAAPPLNNSCAATAKRGLVLWAKTFQPTGDPINESRFIPIFQAIDLIRPSLSLEERSLLFSWLRKFSTQGDSFYSQLKANDPRRINNWMAWRLLIRGLIAVISEDLPLQNDTGTQLQAFLPQNFLQTNGLADGRTFDYIQRDAVHYHIYDLQPLVDLSLFCPVFASTELKADLSLGFEFLRPYFLGQKQHIEFVNSSVPFDSQRCQAGQKDYCHLPWIPVSARGVLRMARALLPEIRDWTTAVVDDQYDPRLKLLAVAYGDLQE